MHKLKIPKGKYLDFCAFCDLYFIRVVSAVEHDELFEDSFILAYVSTAGDEKVTTEEKLRLLKENYGNKILETK